MTETYSDLSVLFAILRVFLVGCLVWVGSFCCLGCIGSVCWGGFFAYFIEKTPGKNPGKPLFSLNY